MSRICLENMEFYAYHGCFAEETAIGTKFLVNVEMELNTEHAQQTDDIHDTVSYLDVYREICHEMKNTSKLLENVAERIANRILQKFVPIHYIYVKVSKLNPPLGGKLEAVSIALEKRR